MERGGAGRDRQHVLGLEEAAHPLLELGRARAGRQPPGAERLRDGRDLFVAYSRGLEADCSSDLAGHVNGSPASEKQAREGRRERSC